MRSQNPFDVDDMSTSVPGRVVARPAAAGMPSKGGRLKPRKNIEDDEEEGGRSCMSVICSLLPLRYFCFLGGVGLVLCTVLDTLWNDDTMIQFFLRLYLIIFGLLIMIIEGPSWRCTRYFQLRVFFWYRILSRMWGRAWFYLFLTMLCFGEFDRKNAAEFTIMAGFYLLALSLISFVCSKLAANKLERMFTAMGHGSEGDALLARIERKYDEIVYGSNKGYVGRFEIMKLADQADRELSSADLHAIQTFLDDGCHGYVTKSDWMKQFAKLITDRQRFL